MVSSAPWNNVGVDISDIRNDSPTAVSDILERAHLNWEVNIVPLYVMREIIEHDENGDEITRLCPVRLAGHSALQRSCDDAVLDVTGSKFKVIQNNISMAAFVEASRLGDMSLHTAGSLKNGQYIWSMACTKQSRTLPSGESLRGELVMIQPHKNGVAFQSKFVIVREINNSSVSFTLSPRFTNAAWRMSHASMFNDAKKSDMTEMLRITNKYIDSYAEKATVLLNTKWDERESLRYLAMLFQEDLIKEEQVPETISDAIKSEFANRRFKQVAELLNTTPGNKETNSAGTAWGVFSTVTYALDHLLGRNYDNRLANSWLGEHGRVKTRALDLAMDASNDPTRLE